MLNKEYLLNLANKFLGSKVFYFEAPLMHQVPIMVNIKYKIKLLEVKKLITVGEETEHISVEVEIIDIEPNFLKDFFKEPKDRTEIEKYYWYLTTQLKNAISNDLKYFNIIDPVSIEKIYMTELNTITEGSSSKKGITRSIVKDIVSIFKKGEGEYTLPEDLTGEFEYEFENMNTQFSVEVRVVESENIDGFDIDGGFYSEDETFEIDIHYNPRYFPQLYYDFIGDLNDVVRHELQHLIQKQRGEELPQDEEDPEKYYTQPHELDAQIAGFRRVSKLRKEPIENTIRSWYSKKENLTDDQKERIVNKILQTIKSY